MQTDQTGLSYHDYGCYSTESCDYPDFAKQAAKAVADGECEKGVVICTTGIGISIAANKVKGVRCALCADSYSAKMTRLHNDANMLAMEILDVFLDTPFSEEEKHARRVAKLEEC